VVISSLRPAQDKIQTILEKELKTRKKKKKGWRRGLSACPVNWQFKPQHYKKTRTNKTKQKQKTLENKQKNQMSSHPCWLQRPGENSNGKYILFCVICKFIYIDGTLSN
jgi:hypothetical protein